jgi:hypothetical protein
VFFACGTGTTATYCGLHINYYGTNTITGNVFINDSHDQQKCGIWENASGGDDTKGNNIITSNQFLRVNSGSPTTLDSAMHWSSGSEIVETNTNMGAGNTAATGANIFL